MSELGVNSFVGRHDWLRHYVPWLAALTMLMGLLAEEPLAAIDPEERLG